jgi:hypothetical protein
VSFDAFARLFRDGLNCPNALFLDGGSAASLYAPSLTSFGNIVSLGPMLGYSENSWRQSAVTGAHWLDDCARAPGLGAAERGLPAHDLFACVTMRLDINTSPKTPPHDHPSVAGENAAADLVADRLCTRVGAPFPHEARCSNCSIMNAVEAASTVSMAAASSVSAVYLIAIGSI